MAKPKKTKRASKGKVDPHKVTPPRRFLDTPLDELADAVTENSPPGPASRPLSLHPLSPEEALRRAMRAKGD